MRALDRFTAVLDAVASSPEGLTLSDLAVSVELSPPTVSRLSRAMAELGLLYRVEATGTFRLGPKLAALAYTASAHGWLLDIVTPLLEELTEATKETTSLHVAIGNSRVCIKDVHSPHQVRRVVPPGLVLPLHIGATGSTLLAFQSPSDIDQYVSSLDPDMRSGLRERLKVIQRRGWDLAVDEWIEGVAGLAAPLLVDDRVMAVVSISGPSSRWTEESMASFAPRLLEAIARVAPKLSGIVRPN